MNIIYKLSNLVFIIEKGLAIILGSIILIALSAGVLYRYVFDSPLSWSDEAGMFSLAWITFIGGSMSIKLKSSPTIDVLTNFLRGKVKKYILVLGYLIMFVFVSYVLYLSIVWISSPNIMLQRSGSMGLPMIIPYLSIPVSFTFMVIHSLEVLLKSFTNTDEGVA
ncbi:TRAP transporter small permease [Oceanobacillus rekensis]|uniref:TRAP transporter small permease n=1 Tax=Oceanobacillus rekensis TaxID=937927 RepID=UPI000B4321DB|nr:TRAP transporter small permease [Oceanobacillus rekensis]